MSWEIGPARPEDNAGLLALSQAAMVSSQRHAYWLDRSPDYMGFSRIQGRECCVLVARQAEHVIGTLSVSFDWVYLECQPRWVAYTSDLRVAQGLRGSGLADQLMRVGIETARTKYPDIPIMTCVMQDNPAGLKKNTNLATQGIAHMAITGAFHLYFFPTLLCRPKPMERYQIRSATDGDIEAMFKLWSRCQPKRNLSPAWRDPADWFAWMAQAPNLSIEHYLLVHETSSPHLVGLVGLWDQTPLRRVMLKQSWPLPLMHAIHLCVETPAVLGALWPAALEQSRKRDKWLLATAMAPHDPRQIQLKTWWHGRSALWLLSNYPWRPPHAPLFHMEIALG